MQDRQIILTRVFNALPATVWRAWTDPELLPLWFGPKGFHCETKEIALHQGGLWRFDMIAPDGTVFANRHRYTLSDAPHRLHYLLDADVDGDTPIEVEVTLTPEGTGTRLTLQMTLPTPEARAQAASYGAVELGNETLAKLAAIVEA